MHALTITSGRTTHTFTWPTYMVRHLIDALSCVHPPRLLGDTLDFEVVKVHCDNLYCVLHHIYDETETSVPPAVEHVLSLLRPTRAKRRRAPVAKDKILQRRKDKIKRGAYVTINMIAQELGVSGRDCRQALRKLSVPKPEHGWAWAPSDANLVKGKLTRYFSKRVARQTPISKDEENPQLPLQNGEDHLI